MSKIRKDLKKVVAGILSVTLVAGSVHMLGSNSSTVQAANVTFGTPVLKIGVMSDLHLNRGTYTSEQIKSKVTQYAKGVGTLEAMSGDGLDVLMLGGDYTNNGNYEQGKTFASATKAILEEINKEKDDKTQLLLTYGNHDTEWEGQMSYTEWENLLQNEYGLLSGITYGPKDSGCYKYTRTINEKTYYFYSVETEKYSSSSSNAFRTDVLEWLDVELASTPKDAYVYVISHAPIVESGVYGADVNYCKNAGWASAYAGETSTVTRADQSQYEVSGNIHDVLKDYPQVVYMSGHTHYTNTLESSIMSDMYTAITVSAFNTGDLYNEKSNYLDTIGNASKPGYSLYIEVDANGNQQITRVNTEDSTVVSVEVVGTAGTSTVDPNYGTFTTTEVIIRGNTDGTASTLANKWVMAAPDVNGTHLDDYKASTRTENPSFNDGALELTNISTGDNGDSLSFDFSFPTASCTNSYVIRYEISIYDQNERCIDTRWILGDWTTNTDGCAEGYNHKTAETLSYSLDYTSEQLGSMTGLSAKLVAVNEFGGRSELTWNTEKPYTVLLKPSASGANKNLFDGMTVGQVYSYLANKATNPVDNISKATDEKGVITTIIDATNENDEVTFWTDKDKYEYYQSIGGISLTGLGNAAKHAMKLTSIEERDTFVYETEFKVTSTVDSSSILYFAFRTNDSAKENAQRSIYSGVRISQNNTRLYLYGNDVAGQSTAFKLDNEQHKLTVVSAPKKVSVWIDDEIIFNNVDYDISNYFIYDETNQDYRNPYPTSKVCVIDNTKMLPTVSMYVEKGNVTLTNQYLYLYDTKEQVADEHGATYREYYNGNNMTAGLGENETVTHDSIYAKTPADNITYTFKGGLDSADFNKDDIVVYEFDYTPLDLTMGDANATSNIYHGTTIQLLTDGTNTISIMLRKGKTGSLHTKVGGKLNGEIWADIGMSNITLLGINQKVHFKVEVSNTAITICAQQGTNNNQKTFEYANIKSGFALNGGNIQKLFNVQVYNSEWKFENINITAKDSSLENVTALTDDNNLLTGEYGNITSSYSTNETLAGKSDSVQNGTNIYTDLTSKNLSENGVATTDYKTAEIFYSFGNKNTNYTMGANESFVLSGLVRVSNEKLTDCNHRLGVELASYDGNKLWYFIDTTTLNVYYGNTKTAAIDLSALVGYEVGDYIRLTSSVTPYGIDIYIDGACVYSYEVEWCEKVEFSPSFLVSGVEARILDASIHYNYDNGKLYQEQLAGNVSVYNNLEGIYFEDEESADAVVAQVSEACEDFTGTSNKTISQYAMVIEKLIASGKVVNNMVADDIGTSKLLDLTGDTEGSFILLQQSCTFAKGETWIFEADITCESSWHPSTRVGFGIAASNKPDVMVQGSNAFRNDVSDGPTNYASGSVKDTFQKGDKWHIRYIVKPLESIKTILTGMDGNVIYEDATPVAWTSIKSLSNIKDEATLATATFTPYFYARRVDTKFENIYVGRDLSADISSLNAQITVAEATDISNSTYASVTAMKEKLEATISMREKITGYVGESTAPILTTPYSKAEINEAEATLKTAVNGLVKATAQLTVGDATTGTISIGVSSGDALPKNCYIDDKYIVGWNVNGEAANDNATYTGEGSYVADYVDTDMLDICYQGKADPDKSGRWIVRFFGSVDHLNYKNTGIVLSVNNSIPEVGATGCSEKTTTTVYQSVLADGSSIGVKQIYTTGNSKYMFARTIGNIPNGTMYARAYVTLDDEAGTIVYGQPKSVAVDASMLNAQ